MVSDAYRRNPVSVAMPYILLGFVLTGLFVWRVATTDPNWTPTQIIE